MTRLTDTWLRKAAVEPAFIRAVCEYWVSAQTKELTWLQLSAGVQIANNQRFRLVQALSLLTKGEFIRKLSEDRWMLVGVDFSDLQIIAGAMSGLIWGQHERANYQPRLIATLPVKGALSRALRDVGYKESRHDRTDAFIQGSIGKAEKRFVIMTPFMDAAGAKWALDTFKKAEKHVERIIISRFITTGNDSQTPSGLITYAEEFFAHKVTLLELAISASDTLFLETFHAKLLVVDDDIAYVGSNNFTKVSQEKTLELGVALYGPDSRPVIDLLDAVIKVSTLVDWGEFGALKK